MDKAELHATLEKLAMEYPWDYMLFGKDARHEACDRTFELSKENLELREIIQKKDELISRLQGELDLERSQHDALARAVLEFGNDTRSEVQEPD